MEKQKLNELNYLSEFDDSQIQELWNNCFEGEENLNYINRFVPNGLGLPNSFVVFRDFIRANRAWLIQKTEDSVIIGYMVFGNFIPSQPDSIGIVIGQQYSGKGYGYSSISVLSDILENENYKVINGYCSNINKAAMRIMEENGFIKIKEFELNGMTAVHYEKRFK